GGGRDGQGRDALFHFDLQIFLSMVGLGCRERAWRMPALGPARDSRRREPLSRAGGTTPASACAARSASCGRLLKGGR
ncbi:hypothetical protein PPH41_18615, partial [Burkholderia gladioli]|nr:hypothetical protein [Burkholderia gladioli]